MREIKFRAFLEESKKMITPFRFSIPFEKTGIALMQFTGLVDKNGKEIYEGDVVEVWITELGNIDKTSVTAEVKYFGDYFGVNTSYNPRVSKFTSDNSEICEVIGNIYEHSHLLEK